MKNVSITSSQFCFWVLISFNSYMCCLVGFPVFSYKRVWGIFPLLKFCFENTDGITSYLFITYQAIYPGTFRFTSLFGKSVKYSAVWMFLNLDYCLLMIFSTLLLVSLSLFFSFFNLFTWLFWVLVAACKLGCGMWDLVPWPGIEPGPSALGARNLNHWTTREVPLLIFFSFIFIIFL